MATVGTADISLRSIPASTQAASFGQRFEADTSSLPVVEEAVGLAVIPSGFKAGNFLQFSAMLLAQLKISRRGVLAITYFDKVEEYGAGQTEQEAILDLVSSLAEYKESLEQRESKLADGALADLAHLRRIFQVAG